MGRIAPRVIRAYKRGWPRVAVDRMIAWKVRRAFYRVRAQGLARLRGAIDAEPGGTLILANHSCWWDVFLAHAINEAIPVDGYGMMEHFNMRRFGFFRRIGAFSVDRSDPLAVRESIDYAAGLLRGPRAAVWVFPQGRMVGNDARPLGFRRGIRPIIRRAGRVRVVPTALRYEFWQDERPEALVRFGEPAWATRDDSADAVERFESVLTAELDALRADALTQDAGRFELLIRGAGSISDRYAAAHARVRGSTPGAPPIPPA